MVTVPNGPVDPLVAMVWRNTAPFATVIDIPLPIPAFPVPVVTRVPAFTLITPVGVAGVALFRAAFVATAFPSRRVPLATWVAPAYPAPDAGVRTRMPAPSLTSPPVPFSGPVRVRVVPEVVTLTVFAPPLLRASGL